MSAWPKRLRSLGLGALLALVLGGPTPGSVGSCDQDAQTANAEQFCRARKDLACQRRYARGEIDQAAEMACRAGVDAECVGAAWPADCDPPPTTVQTRACIAALANSERLSEAENAIPECLTSTLCGRSR